MRIARLGIAILLIAPAGIAAAQQAQPSQPQSLADAARRSREQKKDSAKPARFWDNDSIPTTPGSVSVVGDANASSASAATDDKAADSSTKGAAAAAPGSADAAKNSSAAEAGLNAAKEHLKQLTADLDLLTRQNDLDKRTYYGKPDYSKDTDGADNLKREQNQIDAKKQEVADAQKKVDEAQANLGTPPATETKTNPN